MKIGIRHLILQKRRLNYLCLVITFHLIITCNADFLRGSNATFNVIHDGVKTVEGHGGVSRAFPQNAIIPLHAVKGSHHVHLYIGSPPQRQILILDTGSRLTAFTCQPCLDCGKHVSPMYFDPDRSTTTTIASSDHCLFEKSTQKLSGKCEFVQRYTEGSALKAYEIEDVVWLGTDDENESIEEYMKLHTIFTFGCLTSEGGLFLTQYADGIMGVAKSSNSFINAMYNSGAITSPSFSICMTRNGGYLSLGGTPFSFPENYHLEKMQFIDSKDGDTTQINVWYNIEIKEVYFGNILISNQSILKIINYGQGTIIDSGTSDIYLPAAMSFALKGAWFLLNGFEFSNHMVGYTYEKFNSLPSLIIILKNGYQWHIGPGSYMEESATDKSDEPFDEVNGWPGIKILTTRIYPIEKTGSVLGANAMFGHDILFERNRIGIARANCNMS